MTTVHLPTGKLNVTVVAHEHQLPRVLLESLL